MKKILKHAELDRKLDRLAADPDGFVEGCRRLAKRLDRERTDHEFSDPLSWRRERSSNEQSARVPLNQQFRADVESILPLDREEEAQLARRIEFLRLRLQMALEAEGIPSETWLESAQRGTFGVSQAVLGKSDLPARVYRRWMELHALRVELVERNLYLVLINVERYSHTSAHPFDLIQEANAALFRAVDGFDWRRGLLFRTYAVHWLNQAFRSHLYNFSNTVRVPVYLQKALKHVNDAKARLGDHKASVEAIAEESELAENLVQSALTAVRSSRSLDAALDDDGGRLRDLLDEGTPPDPYSPELEEVSLQDGLRGAMHELSDRERFVVEQRFGLGIERERTLAEVAADLGVSLERVRQIQVRAIHKLRTPGLRKVVEPFLN
ncbi:MAG TPA: sigma-70 family RNA polymerase sigma factor [Planctomycetota bacterium]|nr:sigma-70 family RNA polymerase sigma factor [Planctomycetota bacterium]